jgi:hypothetical protein
MVANVPKFSNRVLHAVAGNWQLAPILQLKSGPFLTVTTGTDTALTTVANQPGNQLLENTYSPTKGQPCGISGVAACVNVLNRAAFGIPASGTYGNMRYGTVLGPGLIQLNMAVSRTFPLRERQSLQVRAEAFNLPNHLNPLILPANLNLSSALFGVATADQSGIAGQVGGVTSGDYRVVQLALKLLF